MSKTTISIITPTFNSVSSIGNTLNSVLNQKYIPDEYIIIDNASADGTLELVSSYKKLFARKNICLQIISEPDKGIYDAINKGVQHATGDWIGIINSDDYYDLMAIKRLYSALEINIFDIFHGNLIIFDSDQEKTLYYPVPEAQHTMSIFHPTMFISKNAYLKVGLYDLKFKLSADFDWIVRARKNGLIFHYDNNLISYYYKFGESYRSRMKGIFENYQIRKMHFAPLTITYYYFVKEVVFGPLKSYLMKLFKR